MSMHARERLELELRYGSPVVSSAQCEPIYFASFIRPHIPIPSLAFDVERELLSAYTTTTTQWMKPSHDDKTLFPFKFDIT